MIGERPVLVVVHPGSACGSADFNLGIEAAVHRDGLAREINEWTGDVLIVDGELSDELDHYAFLGLAIANAQDVADRRLVRERACDFTHPEWPTLVADRYRAEWPGGPHRVVVTGAWYGDGCVDAVVAALSDQHVTVSPAALRS